jgi:predicted dehydrogenase
MLMLSVGIVGAGLRGKLFADALRDQPGVQVAGFAEPSAAVAESARAATNLPVWPSHTALLEELDPDAVIVATPDFAHREVAVDVAVAGKHLLIEKPLATTLADARAIADAVRQGGGRCLIGFENRWNPHAVTAKRAIDEGALGSHITTSATLSNSYYVPTQMLAWGAKSSPAWFLMPHTLDLLLWLTGRMPSVVSAVASRGVLAARGVDTWDVVHALITLDDGSTANLSSSWVLPDAGEGIVDFHFSLIGTHGSVGIDMSHQGLTLVSDKYRSAWPLDGRIGRAPVGMAAWMAQDFAAGLLDGTDVGPGVDHGLLITEIICAVERSMVDGQPVRLASMREELLTS